MTAVRSSIVAAVQSAPVFLDRAATVEKACALMQTAAEQGAQLVVFPESYIPTYPVWAWYIPMERTHELRELYGELADNAVAVPGEATDRLCECAGDNGVTVTIGITELDASAGGCTLYNTLLFIGADGTILGKHRKLVPTTAERVVWGQGSGNDLHSHATSFGRLAGLICWENYMPLARYAIYSAGVDVYVAPTWDHGEPWLSTMRHIAKEGRCYVVGVCSALHRDDIPDHFAFKQKYLPADVEWLNPGHSVIVDPDGKVLAGPANPGETILYAEVRRELLTGPRFQLDVVGHYARPDVFQFKVRSPNE